MNHQRAAMVEAVGMKGRIVTLAAQVAELESRIINQMETIGSLETTLEKIEAEAHRGITLEPEARSALQTIAALARRKP